MTGIQCLLSYLTLGLALTLAGCAPYTGLSESETTPSDTTPATGATGKKAPISGYRIGPEDVLRISVWKEADLQRDVLVRPDGGISFPLAGDLVAAGKTPEQLEQEITQRVRAYIPDAVVTVSVEKVSGYTIFVIGRVTQPGQFTLGRYVDVIQALTLAGGVTPFASEDDIQIRRRVGGREVVYPFNYAAVKKGDNNEQNIVLQSGDVVVVP